MRVSVVCTFSFPEGLAASARIISYMKGLHQHGAKTDVFIYRPTDLYTNPSSYPAHGTYEGINYKYPNTRVYSKYKICRFIGRYYYWGVTCYNIWKENKADKIDFLLISNDFLNVLFLFTLWAKILGIKPVFITDEYPEPIRVHLKKDIPNWKKRFYNFILKYEDSFIFMTEKLNVFFNRKLNKPYHILPTITDTSRFNVDADSNVQKKYMCYMGNMELSKDNVDNIIRAFSVIANKYPDIDFYLYGAPSPKDYNIIVSVIEECNLSDRVFIKGRVSSLEVPVILKSAYLLVSSQPNSKRAEGGFPTKLGEYMATGVPAILTDVGEITKYVQDGVHVYIVEPENHIAYANKLDFILSNYSEALSIASTAKEYLLNNFDYKSVSKNLLDFLYSRL